VNLALDKAGNVLVVSYTGAGIVYSFNPNSPDSEITLLKSEPVEPRSGMTPVVPASDWRINPQALGQPFRQFISPDRSIFLSAGQDFVNGTMSWGVKAAAVLRSFGLSAASPGRPVYLTSEADVATWRAAVASDGSLSDFKLFANQGGESVAVDDAGNVYIAAGQIFVYDPSGHLIDTIDVPERPTQLVFSSDGQTLFIPARTSLYAMPAPSSLLSR
jgi:hypothetical protein